MLERGVEHIVDVPRSLSRGIEAWQKMCVVRVLCLRSCCVFVSLSCLGVVPVPRSCSGVALLLPLLCLNHFSFVLFFLSAQFFHYFSVCCSSNSLGLSLMFTLFSAFSKKQIHLQSRCPCPKRPGSFDPMVLGGAFQASLAWGLAVRHRRTVKGSSLACPHGANFELVHLGVDDSWFLSWWSRDQDAAQRCRSFGLAPIQCLSVEMSGFKFKLVVLRFWSFASRRTWQVYDFFDELPKN